MSRFVRGRKGLASIADDEVLDLLAELATAREQVETLREALTGVLPGVDDAWALWPDGRDAVLKARATLAATEPKG